MFQSSMEKAGPTGGVVMDVDAAARWALFILVCVWALSVPDLAWAAGGRDTTVFDQAKDVTDTFNDSAIAVVRSIGIGAFLVCGAIMLLTGKLQGRMIAGVAVGLLVAAFAKPAVNFLFPATTGG